MEDGLSSRFFILLKFFVFSYWKFIGHALLALQIFFICESFNLLKICIYFILVGCLIIARLIDIKLLNKIDLNSEHVNMSYWKVYTEKFFVVYFAIWFLLTTVYMTINGMFIDNEVPILNY